MITLGIETSCDETAVAVVEDGFGVRTNLIAAQVHLHERFGGVVPEVAARAHVEALNPLLAEAIESAGLSGFGDIDGVAVTVGPGLVGALLVGMAAAKSVSLATGAGLIGVNHLEGHIWANFLTHGPPETPYVALVVSGGHTMIVHMPEPFRYEVVASPDRREPDGETFLTKNVDAAILGVTLELKGRGHDGPLARCAGRTGARSAPECRAGRRRQRPVPDLLLDERDAVLSVHHAAPTLSRRLRCPPIAVYIHTPSDRNDRAGYGETGFHTDAPAGWEISFLASALGPDELGLST